MDEEKTIKLVKELAETLENVAVGPLHTPRLYSTFLKAVIASKTGATVNDEKEGLGNGEPSEPPTSPSIHTSPSASIQSPHLQHHPQQAGTQLEIISPPLPPGELSIPAPPPTNGLFQNYDYYFQNDGEMGTVVDISTFPPTMADHDQSSWPSLSVDNIFSGAFWDNVLVPGMFNLTAAFSNLLRRLRVCDTPRYLRLAGRSQWWFRVWSWRKRVNQPWIRDVSHSIWGEHPAP